MTNARTTPTKNQKLAFKVATVMERLVGVAEDLSALYEENPDLNDLQPNSMQAVIPASLDEWARALNACRDDWYLAALRGMEGVKAPQTEGAVRDDTLPAFTANVQLLLPVEVTNEGEACDAITGLLTECGIYDGALLDWGYVRGEDGKYTGPREVRIPADYDREEHCVADLVATKVSGA